MSRKPNARISTFGSQLTSIISVTLVLLILGILAITMLASRGLGDDIRSNIGFIVKINSSADDTEINRLKRELTDSRFTESITYISAEEILREESELMGEPLDSLLDENPFGSELDIKVRPEYATTDSIAMIASRIELIPSVDEVITEAAIVDSVNSVLSRTSIVLIAIAIALLIISFVLINNTVSLSVYSRRFIIHTMKLVGATGSFIRRPFLLAGAMTGVIAGVSACGILAGMRAYASTFDPLVDRLVSWADMAIIFGGLIVVGLLICVAASALSTNRYLRADYDEMFMK